MHTSLFRTFNNCISTPKHRHTSETSALASASASALTSLSKTSQIHQNIADKYTLKPEESPNLAQAISARQIYVDAKKTDNQALKKNARHIFYQAYAQKSLCRWHWFNTGVYLWSLPGILRLNISGIEGAWVALGKQLSNVLISPILGSYADVAIGVPMQLCVRGMPNIADDIKNSPNYATLASSYQNLTRALRQDTYHPQLLSKKSEIAQAINALNTAYKKQNALMKISLLASCRSVVGIITSTVFTAMIFGTGGVGVLGNALGVPLGFAARAIATGLDNLITQNLTLSANLKYADVWAEADASKKNAQLMSLWQDRATIRTNMVCMIYTYYASHWQSKVDQASSKDKKIYWQKKIDDLLKDIDAFHAKNWQSMNPKGLLFSCLAHDAVLCIHGMMASTAQTNQIRGQVIKNYGTGLQGLAVAPFLSSLAADAMRYDVGGMQQQLAPDTQTQGMIFGLLKSHSGFLSALGRTLSTSCRQRVKSLLQQTSAHVSAHLAKIPHTKKTKKINIITKELYTPQGIKLDLLTYEPQYTRTTTWAQRTQNSIKGIYLSSMALYSMPWHFVKTLYYKRQALNLVRKKLYTH